MKRVYFLLSGILMFSFLSQAQEEDPISDEELKKYALVMDFADVEKKKLQDSYNELIQSHELMDGGKRFVEIKEAKGDEAKMEELAITEEELAAYEEIEAKNEENIATFKEAYTAKIKDKEVLGAGIYNSVRKALKSDEELKTRYEAIITEIQEERTALAEEIESETQEVEGGN
ncbi:MAG: hypothetical protein AAF363_09160 [Bacteroidota bacterium]